MRHPVACFNLSLSCIQVLSMPTIYRTLVSCCVHMPFQNPATAYLPICCMELNATEFSLFMEPDTVLSHLLTLHMVFFLNAQPCLSISCMSSCYGVSNFWFNSLVGFSDVLRGVCPDIYITVPVLRDNVYLEVILLLRSQFLTSGRWKYVTQL